MLNHQNQNRSYLWKMCKHLTHLRILSIVSVLVFFQIRVVSAQAPPRDFLQKEYHSKGGLSPADLKAWRKEKVNSLRESISRLPEEEKKVLIAMADSGLQRGWPSLRISDFLKYKNEDNILAWHTPSAARQAQLTNLIIGELVSGKKGKYLEEIANGLWLLLEQSTWVSPHHMMLQKAGEELPDPYEQIISLGSADVASLVGWTRLLFHDELDRISPMIIKKIDHKLDQEIFTPFLTRDDLHWLGFGTGKVNNWNIWINTNILITALTAVDDDEKRSKIIAKTVLSADKFLNKYPEDGGCDEGVTYWNEAGGRLIQFAGLLMEASHNKLDWSDNGLIHRMGTYIYKMHIGEDQFVSFADAFARNFPHPPTVYQFGKIYNDTQMKQFAAYLRKLHAERSNGKFAGYGNMNGFIKELETREGILAEKQLAPLLKENWLPDLQILTLRENQGSTKGLFFAAKGGHNAESHNHNDIGNFILYIDGEPGLIDAGVDTYVKATFSKDRYTLWNMQSQWHNTPSINGHMQMNGRKFEASEVNFTKSGRDQKFSLDISKAYPEEAGVSLWKREFIFSGTKGLLTLKEDYKLNKFEKPFDLHFMTSMNIIEEKDGRVRISRDGKSILMDFDPKLFEVVIEDRHIAEGRLRDMWGDQLKRISLRSKGKALSGTHVIKFSR